MAKLKIQKTANGITVDSYVSPTTINSNNIGGTGGDNGQTVNTIRNSFLRNTGGAVDTGYIIFQKGMRKFEVNNTSDANTTVATLVNKLESEITVANTMTILANVNSIAGANLANIGTGGGGYTNNRQYAYLTWTSANVTGYATPTVGHQVSGTGLTGNVTVVAVNSSTNVTVGISTQTVTTAQTTTIKESFNVSRISNKYVWDWEDTKYRYWFSAPYTNGSALSSQPAWQGVVFVQVDSN